MKLEHYDLPWTKLEWRNNAGPLSWCQFMIWLNDLKERMMPGTYQIHSGEPEITINDKEAIIWPRGPIRKK